MTRHRIPVLLAVVAAVLLGPLALARLPGTTAQEATPAAAGDLPLELLGSGPSVEAPGNGLGLAQITFLPGFTDLPPHVHPFDYVVWVESGTLAFRIEAWTLLLTRAGAGTPAAGTPAAAQAEAVPTGVEATVGPGDSFAGTRDVAWSSERVVGDEPWVGIGTFFGARDAPEEVYVEATPGAAGTPAP